MLTLLSICVWLAADYHYVFLALALANIGSATAYVRCDTRAWENYVTDALWALAFMFLGSVAFFGKSSGLEIAAGVCIVAALLAFIARWLVRRPHPSADTHQ